MFSLSKKHAGKNVRNADNCEHDPKKKIKPQEDSEEPLRGTCAAPGFPHFGMRKEHAHEKVMRKKEGNSEESQTTHHEMEHRQQIDMLVVLSTLVLCRY